MEEEAVFSTHIFDSVLLPRIRNYSLMRKRSLTINRKEVQRICANGQYICEKLCMEKPSTIPLTHWSNSIKYHGKCRRNFAEADRYWAHQQDPFSFWLLVGLTGSYRMEENEIRWGVHFPFSFPDELLRLFPPFLQGHSFCAGFSV